MEMNRTILQNLCAACSQKACVDSDLFSCFSASVDLCSTRTAVLHVDWVRVQSSSVFIKLIGNESEASV